MVSRPNDPTPQCAVQEGNRQLNSDLILSVSVLADSLLGGQPNHDYFPDGKQSAATFETLIKIPKMNRQVPRKQRKVAHAVVATSSPFKAALQISFDNKEQKRQAKERRQCEQKLMRTGSTRRKRTTRATQQSTTKRKGKSKSAMNQVVETSERSDTDDEPLSKLYAKSTESTATRCSHCNKVEGPNDRHDWISCCGCGKWLHEYCAEESGVFDDAQYFCITCI